MTRKNEYDKDNKDKVIDFFEEGLKRGKFKEKERTKLKKQKQNNIEFGNSNIGNNFVYAEAQSKVNNKIEYNLNKRVVNKNIIQPSDNAINPAQRKLIQEKISNLVAITNKNPENKRKSFAGWWNNFYKVFKVNSYAEITQDQFEDAIKWLTKQEAANRPKLRRKDNPKWRNELYAAIYARAKELGLEKEDVYAIVSEKLDKEVDSLKELGEQNLEKLHGIIMRMKRN